MMCARGHGSILAAVSPNLALFAHRLRLPSIKKILIFILCFCITCGQSDPEKLLKQKFYGQKPLVKAAMTKMRVNHSFVDHIVLPAVADVSRRTLKLHIKASNAPIMCMNI